MTRRARAPWAASGASALAVAGALALGGCGSAAASAHGRAPENASGSASGSAAGSRAGSSPGPTSAGAAGAAESFRSARTYDAVAEPVRLRIPAIGVDSRLVHLGLAPDGTIAAPARFEQVGWYAAGPRPGQPGPAILLGHVDSKAGPAVFYRLAGLRPGDAVVVDRADGSSVRFRVSGRLQVAKSSFPADLLYAPTLAPVLRLVTCGGDWDATKGHYRDNVVVSAVPEGSR
jgi:sortase (surface protein transpeptidase)